MYGYGTISIGAGNSFLRLTVFGCMFVCIFVTCVHLLLKYSVQRSTEIPVILQRFGDHLEICPIFCPSAELLQERRRASNTGKLLKLLMPHQTDILVHGVAEDEERLQELISNQSYFCFVVYPSEDAVPVSTISSTLALQKCSKIPVAVLIDGTWNQAQRMHKHFEEMQHVIVFPAGAVEGKKGSWIFCVISQTFFEMKIEHQSCACYTCRYESSLFVLKACLSRWLRINWAVCFVVLWKFVRTRKNLRQSNIRMEGFWHDCVPCLCIFAVCTRKNDGFSY